MSNPNRKGSLVLEQTATLVVLLGLASLTRLGAVKNPHIDFDADEAIVGLMARQILDGSSWPVFYAGQGYLGALEAWTAALVFLVFGESPEGLRLVPFVYTLGFLIAQYFLLKRFFERRAVALILLWTSLGTPFLNLWGVKARGGFVEVLLAGSLFLLLFHRAWRDGSNRGSALWSLGAVAGIGYFINPLIGTVMLTPLLLLVREASIDWARHTGRVEHKSPVDILLFRYRNGLVRLVFFIFATIGLIFAVMALGVATFGDIRTEYPFRIRLLHGTRLIGIAVAYFSILYVGQFVDFSLELMARRYSRIRLWWNHSPSLRIFVAITSGIILVSLIAELVASFADGGGYGRPLNLAPIITWPRNARLVFLELLPAVLGYSGSVSVILTIVFVSALVVVVRTYGATPRDEVLLFGGGTLCTILLVTTSSYTVDLSVTRYFVPLLLTLPATVYMVSEMLYRRPRTRLISWAFWFIFTIALTMNAFRGPASLFSRERAPDAMAHVVRRLHDLNIHTVVGDYWTVYPIAFLSRDAILVAPADGFDRFPSMSARVKATGPDAYVFSETAPSLQSFRQSPEGADLQPEQLAFQADSGPSIYMFRRRLSPMR